MVAEGHRTRKSEAAPRLVREAAILESVRVSRVTLSYYKPIRPISRASGRMVHEAAMVGLEVTNVPPAKAAEEYYPDAALGSFGNTMILEVIIGNDDRVRVAKADLSRIPFRQISALRIQSRTGKMFVGTGWFIGPRALATAGHCVYMQNEGGWVQSIDVIPGKFGTSEPFGKFRATRFRSVDGWTDWQSRDFDYGVILLDGVAPGDQVGWFSVSAEPDSELQKTQANISGYPADRDNANFQYFHARPIMHVTPTRLEYDIDTFGGQSGSPVWRDSDDGVVAVGVHTNGGVSSNSGTRINDDVIKNLVTWRDE